MRSSCRWAGKDHVNRSRARTGFFLSKLSKFSECSSLSLNHGGGNGLRHIIDQQRPSFHLLSIGESHELQVPGQIV